MAKIDTKEYNPLAINILRLQKYRFNERPLRLTLEDVVFFEYIIVKSMSFRYIKWFHSLKTISTETGIKKAKLKNIILKFETLDFIQTEIKGFPKVTYFDVLIDEIHDNLRFIYQLSEIGQLLSENGKLLSYFSKLLSDFRQQKELREGTYKKPNKNNSEIEKDVEGFIIKKSFSASEIKTANGILSMLDNTYNSRRKLANKKKKEEEKREFDDTVLPKGKKVIYQVCQAMVYKSENEINNAFIAFSDSVLSGTISIQKNMLLYFFAQKEDGEFDVIDTYLEYFNQNYGRPI